MKINKWFPSLRKVDDICFWYFQLSFTWHVSQAAKVQRQEEESREELSLMQLT